MFEDDQTRVDTAEAVVLRVLPVGGGIVALSPLPGAGGDYKGDMDHLASWRPAMVVTLATQAEMLDAGAEKLGQNIQDKGTRWVHLAMKSGESLNAGAEETWFRVSIQARKALLGGGRVMIQSARGRGRADMLALRLMIEAGEAPDEAQARLEALQGGLSLEIWQLNWALRAEREPVPFVRHGQKSSDGRRFTAN